MNISWKKCALFVAIAAFVAVVFGFLLPEELIIPVRGATRADWNCKY